MSDDVINTVFQASLGSGTQETFSAMQKGFRELAKELQTTAKAMIDLQRTEAADAIGHISLALERFAGGLSGLGGSIGKAKKDIEDFEKAEKSFANTSQLAQQAWAVFKEGIAAGDSSLAVAKTRAMEYDKALNNLIMDIKLLGGSEADLNKNITFEHVSWLKLNEGLEVTSKGFKNLTRASYEYLVESKEMQVALRELHNTSTLYVQTLREAAKTPMGESNVKAIKELGQQVGYAEEKFKLFVPILRNMESSFTKLAVVQKELTGASASWISQVDRAAVANKILSNSQTGVTRDIDLTAKGFKILSMEGLQLFGNLTLKTASDLGMLDANFVKFNERLASIQSLSGMTNQQMEALSSKLLKDSNSFELASKEAAKFEKELRETVNQSIKAAEAVENLSVRYRKMLSDQGRLSEEANRYLKILTEEPTQIKNVQNELARLNGEYNTQVSMQSKASAEIKKLIKDNKDLLFSTNENADAAWKLIDILSKEPKRIEEVRNEVNKLGSAYKQQIKDQNEVASNIDFLERKYKELLTTETRQSTEALKLMKDYSEGSLKIEHLRLELSKLNRERLEEIKAAEAARLAYTNLNVTYEKLLKSETEQGAAARKVIESLREEGTVISTVSNQLRMLNKDFENAGNQSFTFAGMMNRLATSFKTYASYMISSSVLVGFISSISKAKEAVIEFDQTLHNLKSVMQATETEAQLMGDVILKVAVRSKFSLKEVSEEMIDLAQAGHNSREAIAGIQNIANLATGTMEGLKESAKLTSTAVVVFGKGMEQSAQTSDMFANAVTKSRLTVSGMNTILNYLGPVARQASMSLQDTTAMMMTMAQAGLKFSTIGTGATQVLDGLIKPSKAFKQAIEDAGYSVRDFNPKFVSFESIMAKLPYVVKNSEDALNMFSDRGARAILALTASGSARFNQFRGDLEKTGTAAEMAAEQMKGMSVSIDLIKNKFEAFAVSVSKSGLAVIFDGILSAVNGLMDALGELSGNRIGNAVLSFGVAVAAFQSLNIAVRMTSFLIKEKLGEAFAAAAASSSAFIATPLGATLTAIAVVVSAAVSAWSNYREAMEESIKRETSYVSSMQNTKEKLNEYNDSVRKHGRSSKEAVESSQNLKGSLTELSKESNDAEAKFSSFANSIGEGGKIMGDANSVMRSLSNTLSEEITQSTLRASERLQELHEHTTIVSKTFHTFGLLFSPISNTIKKWSADLAENLGVIDATDKAYFLAGKRVKQFAEDKVFNDQFRKSLEELTKAYEDWNKEVKNSNNADMKKEFAGITQYAREYSEELLRGKKVAELSDEAVIKMVRDFGEKNKLSAKEMVAFGKAVQEQVESIKKLGYNVSEFGENTAQALSKVRETFNEMNENEKNTFASKKKYLEEQIPMIKQVLANELVIRKEAQAKELAEFKGDEIAQREMAKRHQKEITAIENSGKDASLQIMKMKSKLIGDEYGNLLKNAKNYHEVLRKYEDESYKISQDKLKAKYEREKYLEEESVKDVSRIAQHRTSTDLEMYSKLRQNADAHYSKMMGLAKEEFNQRTAITREYPEDEKKTGEKVLEINKEYLLRQKAIIEQRRDHYKTTLDALIAKEKELTQKIHEEVQKRADFNKSVDQILRELSYKTMTDEEIHQSKMTEAAKMGSMARQLYANGEYKNAADKAKEALDMYRDVAGSLAKNSDMDKYRSDVSDIGKKIKDMSGIWNEASKSSESSLKSQTESVRNAASKFDAGMTDMEKTLDSFEKKRIELEKKPFKINLDDAIKDFQTIENYIDKMNGKALNVRFVGTDVTEMPLTAQLNAVKKSMDNIFPEEGSGAVTAGKRQFVITFKGQDGISTKGLTEVTNEVKTKLDEIAPDENSASKDKSGRSFLINFKGNISENPEPIKNSFDKIEKSVTDVTAKMDEFSKREFTVNIVTDKLREVLEKIKEIEAEMQKLAQYFEVKLGIKIQGMTELQQVYNMWSDLRKEPNVIEKIVKFKKVYEESGKAFAEAGKNPDGSKIPEDKPTSVTGARAATGMRVPGFGGGDNFPAILEPGEWVINKYAVKDVGDDFMEELNNRKLKGKQVQFSSGGKADDKKKPFNSTDDQFGLDASKIAEWKKVSDDIKSVANKVNKGNDLKALYEKINAYANEIQEQLQWMSDLSGTGALGIGVIAEKMPRDGMYHSSGSEEPNSEELSAIISSALRGIRNKTVGGPYMEDKISILQSFRDKLKELKRSEKKESVNSSMGIPEISDVKKSTARASSSVGGVRVPTIAPTSVPLASQSVIENRAATDFSGNTVTHKVRFDIAGQSYGPFTGKQQDIGMFLQALKTHKLRTAS